MNLVSQRATSKKVILATRKSALAMWQANTVYNLFAQAGFLPELLPTVTSGDKLQKGALAEMHVENAPSLAHLTHLQTGKGLFVKEIQEHMLAGLADVAVHSMKDLPVAQTPGLSVVGILPRAPHQDVLILSPQVLHELETNLAFRNKDATISLKDSTKGTLKNLSFAEVRNALLECKSFCTGVVGTTSARRQMQMRAAFSSDLNLEVLRGNVDTRLSRVRNNEFAAILLAHAGLDRLGLYEASTMIVLPADPFVPAPAQGVIAIETIDSRADLNEALGAISHLPTLLAAAIERLVLDLLGGDCHTAVAVHYSKGSLAIECGRDGKCVSTVHLLTTPQLDFLNTQLASCKGNYSVFMAHLEKSDVAKSLHDLLKKQGFAAVSHLRD